MKTVKNAQSRLLDQTAKEQSFRKQIVLGIIQLLRDPRTDPILRFFTVLALIIVIFISFVFSICLVHAIVAIIRDTDFHPQTYGYFILVPILMLMGVAIPFVLKAGKVEQSLRLDDSFNKIYEARFSA